jgi:hypothetical protein
LFGEVKAVAQKKEGEFHGVHPTAAAPEYGRAPSPTVISCKRLEFCHKV